MKELIELLKLVEEEKNEGVAFEESLNRLRLYSDKFDSLQQQWINQIGQGIELDIKALSDILKQAIDQRKENHEYPNPKRLNPMYILSTFSDKLKTVSFFADQNYTEGACNCQIRIQHHIAPEITFLHKIGSTLDWAGVEFDIMQCKQCGTKWIKDNAGGSGIIIDDWKEWDGSI